VHFSCTVRSGKQDLDPCWPLKPVLGAGVTGLVCVALTRLPITAGRTAQQLPQCITTKTEQLRPLTRTCWSNHC
jgi:hypothetical protein